MKDEKYTDKTRVQELLLQQWGQGDKRRSMIYREGDKRNKAMSEELSGFTNFFNGTELKLKQRLKGSHNSWEEEKAEAQHMKGDIVLERPKKSNKQERRGPRERSQKQAGECEFDVARYRNHVSPSRVAPAPK